MDKKTITTFLAVMLIIAFFLPYVSTGFLQMSGYKLIFGKGGLLTSGQLWITLLVPLGAVLVLAGALGADHSLRSGIVFWMPLVGILYLGVRMFILMNKAADGQFGIGNSLSVMGYGYWLTLAASIGLLLNNSRREIATAE
jgi:hypothetical protein